MALAGRMRHDRHAASPDGRSNRSRILRHAGHAIGDAPAQRSLLLITVLMASTRAIRAGFPSVGGVDLQRVGDLGSDYGPDGVRSTLGVPLPMRLAFGIGRVCTPSHKPTTAAVPVRFTAAGWAARTPSPLRGSVKQRGEGPTTPYPESYRGR
jgi:hypothetical protein